MRQRKGCIAPIPSENVLVGWVITTNNIIEISCFGLLLKQGRGGVQYHCNDRLFHK